MNINMFSLFILLSIFYMVEGKALQIDEDGTINGEHFNYVYENAYLKENPGIKNLHTGNKNLERRYIPLIDGHPIIIPDLNSNLHETVNTGFHIKEVPEHHWLSTYPNVGQVLHGAYSTQISREPSDNRDSLYTASVQKSPLKNKVNTQIEKTLAPNKNVRKKDSIQKYSYGKELKKVSKSSKKPLKGQMSKSHSMKFGGYNNDKSKELHSFVRNNIKHDETRVNGDNLVSHIDVNYDDPAIIETQSAKHVMNYDYPKVVKDWRDTSESEGNYYKPIIVEKLIKETPSENVHDPVLIRDLTVKKPDYLNLEQGGFEDSKAMETIPHANVGLLEKELLKKEIGNSNLLKEYPSESELTKKNKEIDKSIVKETFDYEEPHIIGVSQKQNQFEKYKLPTETKVIKIKQSDGEIKPPKAISKTAVKYKPAMVSNQKKHKEYKKYTFDGPTGKEYTKKKQIEKVEPEASMKLKAPSKTFVDEYSSLDSISKKNQATKESDSIIGKPINHALDSFTKKKPPVTVVSDKKNVNLYKNEAKVTNEINKGTHINKIKIGDEIQFNKHSPYIRVKEGESHSENYNQDYEMLDKINKVTLPNISQIDLDSLENADNVPFEVGSGLIHERDSNQESRNLFSESGIWSQMVNFHTQERSKFKKCITPKNETGNCMPIQLCPDPNLALALDDLVKKVCSIDDVFIGICCPEFSAETLKVDWENLNSNPSEPENVEEEPTASCGQIVNSGEDVLSWPWMTPLISASTRRIFCGGVLINEQYVLTAAHCTRRIPRNQILVILGPINSTQNPQNQEFTVGEIKRHARYNPRTMQNDIALLKLLRSVPAGDFRRFICLPNEMESFVDEKAIMLGWQGTFEIAKNVEHLRVLSNEECKNSQGEDTLCTEPRTEDSMCNLDSGAPLIIEKDGSYKVIGILTWNRNDCDSRFPAKYTNVSHFRKWIEIHTSS